MRVYIAGIRIAPEHEVLSLADKVHCISVLLGTIHEDAMRKTQGDEDNTLIFVVMCEYALTPLDAIPHEEWETALAVLSEIVKNYKNMILIPGTSSSFENLQGEERIREESATLLENYREITTHPNLSTCDMSKAAGADLHRKLASQPDIGKYIFLRNCAYVLTSKGIVEKNKSLPYLEYKKLPNDEDNSIFYVGKSNPIVRVATECGNYNIGVLICIEHNLLKLPADTTQDNVPIFQVIVSASVELNLELLFAALSIQMDSNDHLKVAINDNHSHADQLADVHCFIYDTNNLEQCSQQVDVIRFKGKRFDEAELQEKPEAPQPAVAPTPLRRSNFTHFSLNRPAWPRKSPPSAEDKSNAHRSGTSLGNSNNHE